MARRTVEPYSMNSNTANFLFRFTISRVFYLDTLKIREREREGKRDLVQRIFSLSVQRILWIERVEKKSRESIKGFYFLLKNIGRIFIRYIVSIEEYINFRGKIFISKNFSIVVFDVTQRWKKFFSFFFFFHYYFDTIKYSLFDFRNAKT